MRKAQPVSLESRRLLYVAAIAQAGEVGEVWLEERSKGRVSHATDSALDAALGELRKAKRYYEKASRKIERAIPSVKLDINEGESPCG